MKYRQWLFTGFFIFFILISWQMSFAVNCNRAFTVRYLCYDSFGYPVGYIGPFSVKNITGVCMPNFPGSVRQTCSQMARECNLTFDNLCQNGCSAGDATVPGIVSCRGIPAGGIVPGIVIPRPPAVQPVIPISTPL